VVLAPLNGKTEGDKIAIKDVNEKAVATVDHVEWNVTRYNLLKPVIILKKAVRLAGANVTRVTAHNAKMVKQLGIGPGAEISIVRSGEVIPKLVDVVKKVKPSLPKEGTYSWVGVDIAPIEKNSEKYASDVTSLQLSNFLSTLKINGFKASMMSKLVEGGVDTIQKLLRASVQRLKACGFGDKQANTLYDSLHERLNTIGHIELAVASNTFPSGFGIRLMRKILTPDMQKKLLTGKIYSTSQIVQMIEEADGIGEITAKQFALGLPKYLKFLNSLDIKISIPTVREASKKASGINGVYFAFTGVRDSDLENMIAYKGGIVSGVTKKTSYLIVKQKGSGSVKEEKAKELGVKIITLPEAIKIVEKA
jgi:DNA ligase (NAD+)